MRTFRYIVALVSLLLGGLILAYSLFPADRSGLGITFGVLLLLNGLLRLYLGPHG